MAKPKPKPKPLTARERELLYQLGLVFNALNIEQSVPHMAGFANAVRRGNPVAAQVEKAFNHQLKKGLNDIRQTFERQKREGVSHER
ncbi:hypothetical protein J9893_06510 [Aeromonas sp. MaB10011B]|uniref:hypothetical protein n=1 Tax=Aeromonas TaxID=642 RepID=UPI001B33FA9F|nr:MULTISPECIES: hypothetical protein [Aeromonas]MBP4066641.1 hypothetical protein [Aeromonas sp. MaB10011B]MBP4079066.1 hypothetical protein [Aeromonas sp. MrichA-1]